MAAAYAGIALERCVDTNARPPELLTGQSARQDPVLVTDDGEAIFDSRGDHAISEPRSPADKLFPRNAAKRTEAERLEALADGIATACWRMSTSAAPGRRRSSTSPGSTGSGPRSIRALDHLKRQSAEAAARRSMAGISRCAPCSATLDLRFAGKWEKGRGKLKRWAARFDEKFPELKALLPA